MQLSAILICRQFGKTSYFLHTVIYYHLISSNVALKKIVQELVLIPSRALDHFYVKTTPGTVLLKLACLRTSRLQKRLLSFKCKEISCFIFVYVRSYTNRDFNYPRDQQTFPRRLSPVYHKKNIRYDVCNV